MAARPGFCAPVPNVRGFFEQHCVKCHSGDKPKGDLVLDDLKADFADSAGRERWERILEQIENGAMPPKAKPRPLVQEQRAVCDWIITQVTAVKAKMRETEGRVVLRRLNRNEYENTVRDLLGVEVKLMDMLPQDSSSNGFDNVGDALHTSSFLMERYIEAAQVALDQAIVNSSQPPKSETKRVTLHDSHQVRSSTENVFRKRDDKSVVMFSSSKWVAATLFYIKDRGRYRFRISASGVQNAGKPVTFSVTSGSGGMGGPKGHLVGYFDAPAEKAKVFEFLDQMEPKTSITILPYDLPSAQSVKAIGAESYTGPGVAVEWVEIEGPLNETWPPESHRRIFGDMRQKSAPIYNQSTRVEVVSDDPSKDAARILTAFARRAFRRPVADAEVKPFVALVAKRMEEGSSFEQAVRAGLAGIMTSPEFLFLRETPGKLNNTQLVSRLSYFLWSSMPDDALLALAEKGRLGDPATLHAQVDRMLKDPKASAFTENFTGQWLGMRDIDFTEPGHILYPHFDDMLKASMLRETHLFFEELIESDLSITNFLASDFAMLNGRLAKHYGLGSTVGWDFAKVTLPPGSHRGGVLTMASVLKVTANGTSTSPVIRGAWVLDRILGTPPKPPPPNVGSIEPDVRGATTIREQLAKHRQIESCASCHAKIDPPGFALESFDVIGGWRERYVLDGRPANYREGKKVDPSDVLPDGRKFANIDDFKKLLLADTDQFARALTTKLMVYATGGVVEATDQRQMTEIVAKARAKNFGFRTLIHEVIASELFAKK